MTSTGVEWRPLPDLWGCALVGRTTVYELIAKRELVAIRIGRARRIPESALDAWIAQQITDEGGFSMPYRGPTTSSSRDGRHRSAALTGNGASP